MATQLFFLVTASDYSSGNNDTNLAGAASTWDVKSLSTTRGAVSSNVIQATVAGLTNGVEAGVSGGARSVWYSPPLDAAVTISGSITWNLRASESANAANAAINGRLEVVDGATGTVTLIDQTARIIELTTSEAAANFAETPAAGVTCKRGDRLRVRVFADDAGTMGSGQTFTFFYSGPTAAASGDSYLTLTENLTFASEPAGTQVFPTDTASAVATASNDKEAWTSRGGGVATSVTNTVTGYTVPIQVTDTAGGTVVDWFTRPLTAFTLGGAVRCNIRAKESASTANAAIRCEIARVEGDGTSPTAWAAITRFTEFATTEGANSFLASGDDLAISNGQRLRIRLLIDDVIDSAAGGMASGQTITVYYAGASGATGDTFLTFTQTLAELVAVTYVPRNPAVNHQNPGVL